MFSSNFFGAIFAIAVVGTIIQRLFVGYFLQKTQAKTPGTWRKDNPRSYIASFMLTVLFSFMFVTIFYIWKHACDCTIPMHEGILFGACFWLAFSFTADINNAVYVNFSNAFVVGKCLGSLAEYIAAGILASVIL